MTAAKSRTRLTQDQNRNMKRLTGCVIACALAGCGAHGEANRENLTAAVSQFLDAHGDMCVGKVNWPIDITKEEAQAHTPNSMQLPALKKVGLVEQKQVSDTTMRFSLTDEGRKYYLHKPMPSVASDGTMRMHEGDLCYGKLHVDKVIGWEPVRTENGAQRTVVTYTYTIDAAPWTRNPDVQQMFPVVAMVVKSGGMLQLKQVVVLTKDGWKGQVGTG
ncbi:hypothetical protein B0G84_6620 [Paraburkholderia sp. BL8N3]|nr:hypothetical protein B0G84_6620 [Paraburkholderia sp. BL8N3]